MDFGIFQQRGRHSRPIPRSVGFYQHRSDYLRYYYFAPHRRFDSSNLPPSEANQIASIDRLDDQSLGKRNVVFGQIGGISSADLTEEKIQNIPSFLRVQNDLTRREM